MSSHRRLADAAPIEAQRDPEHRPSLDGLPVREHDIEPTQGIRTIARLFRGMAVLLVILAGLQVFFAITSTVPLSVGVVAAEVVRLIIFAGLLWGVGDLAVLAIKSHYDLRATRILTTRLVYMQKHGGETDGTLPSGTPTRLDRDI